jgi:hypothetical protein
MKQAVSLFRGAGAAALLAFVLLALMLVPVPRARAVIMATPPALSKRVAEADAIVVARIVGFDDKEISVLASPKATERVRFRIAIIEVTEHVKGVKGAKGAKGEKKLRLGFAAPPQAPADGGISIRPKPRFGPSFKVGQQGLFFLTKHYREPFFMAPRFYDFLSGQDANFSQDVALIRYAAKAGEGLSAGLESKDPQEKFFAAALLIDRYRTYRGGSGKTEAIDAGESERILKALADADWKMEGRITPWGLLSQLGLSAKDGWQAPTGRRSAEERHRAAQAWLREHASTYRIIRILDPPPPANKPQVPSSEGNK